MIRAAMGLLTVLALAPALWALSDTKDKPKSDKLTTPAEEYKAITGEFNKAQQEFFKEYGQAKTNEERSKLLREKRPKPEEYAQRLLKLAENNSKDPAALEALAWVVTYDRSGPSGEKAGQILLRDHPTSDKLGSVCMSLIYSSSPAAEKTLRTIVEKNPHRNVQGQARLALALHLKERSDGKNGKEIERLLDEVVAKYGDVKSARQTLGEIAKSNLFEIRFLAIGKTAPEIEGQDLEGKQFKLTDYRGKVVVLDFWGNW